jgi:alpha-tubulin suppressor-like RCC1 family protein
LLGVGDNSRGQLAYGPIRHIDSISVLETADGTDYNRVFCGDSSAYAITDSGKVWAWGYSTGTSKELSTKSSLKQVEELADMFITQISVGHSTTVFLNGTQINTLYATC